MALRPLSLAGLNIRGGAEKAVVFSLLGLMPGLGYNLLWEASH